MLNLHYDYVKLEEARRQEGLRRAQLNGSAYEYRPKRRLWWFKRSTGKPETAATGVIGKPAAGLRG